MIHVLQSFLPRWKAWSTSSVNSQILVATIVVGALTFLVHVVTAVKELLTAYRFGTADELDAFLIAILLPSLAVVILAWAFPSAAIPIYMEVQSHEGREAAHRLYANILAGSIGFFMAATVLLALLAMPVLTLLASSFSQEKLALTRSLFFMVLPIVTIKGVATIWIAVLNADNRFVLAAIVPAITPLMTVVALLQVSSRFGIYAVVIGTVGGASLEAAILAWHLRRLDIPIIPRWNGWTPAMAQVARQYGSVVAGATLMSSTVLVDQAMAAMLGPGSVSALSYGGKVVSFALAVGATAVGTAVLPHFSRMVAAKDWQGVRHTVRTYVRLIILITVPVTVLAVLLSEPLVRMIFQRGAFTAADTVTVGQVQGFLLLQVPLYLIGILIVRLISSLKANSVLMWGCVINFGVNVVLNYVLMQWLQVAGIALSTAVVYLVSVIYLSVMLQRVLKQCEVQEAVQSRPAQIAG